MESATAKKNYPPFDTRAIKPAQMIPLDIEKCSLFIIGRAPATFARKISQYEYQQNKAQQNRLFSTQIRPHSGTSTHIQNDTLRDPILTGSVTGREGYAAQRTVLSERTEASLQGFAAST